MKNVLVRGLSAAAAVLAVALLGTAAPAAAADSCALLVVCTGAAPVDTGAPTGPPPAQQPEPAPAQQPPAAEPGHRSSAEITADLLVLLNQERASRGLPLLTRHGDVDQVAAGWSDHLADQGALSHNDAYFSEQSRREHGGRALGENVAMDAEAQPAHEHLMASPHHRDNILDARFSVVGLGATYRDGSWWITEDFLQPVAPSAGHEIARSLPPAPPKAPVTPQPAAVPARPAPAAEVRAASQEAPGPRWLVTAPGFATGKTSPLSLPGSDGGMPAPAVGIAAASLCCVGGLFLRRRALAVATW